MKRKLLVSALLGLPAVLIAAFGLQWRWARDPPAEAPSPEQASLGKSDEAARAMLQLRREVGLLKRRVESAEKASYLAQTNRTNVAAPSPEADQEDYQLEEEQVPFEERREMAFVHADAHEEKLLAAAYSGQPSDPQRAQEIESTLAPTLRELGAALTEVKCSDKLCVSAIEYPEESDPIPVERAIVRDICSGECWIRRLRDQSRWKVFSAQKGSSFPNLGPIPTE